MNKFWVVMYMETEESTVYCAFRQHPHIKEFDSKIYNNKYEASNRCQELNNGYCVGFTKGVIPLF